MIGPLVLFIGLLGVWAAFTGKGEKVLDAITRENFSTDLNNAIGNLDLSLHSSGSGGSGSTAKSSAGTTGTSLYNVPIIGPDGTAGTIQVVSHDAAGAVANASQGGNSPTGPATRA